MRITKILYIILILTSIVSCATDDDNSSNVQMTDSPDENPSPLITLIPDPVFEAYLISLDIDDVIDGMVLTDNLVTVEEIVVNNLDITDLTGIEDCPNLFNLWLQNCNVTQLNVISNVALQFIYFDNNNITSIDVSALPLLEKLSGRDNSLASINVSNNLELELLELSDNNIPSIDVSQNTVLNRLDVVNNPLDCIQVNENQLASTTLDWTFDDSDSLSTDCN